MVDSRSSEDGLVIRRRRECLKCERRYTSYERIEHSPMKVIKKNGSREDFSRDKIRSGIEKACEKRPVPADKIEALVDKIECSIVEHSDKEVSTQLVGELVMRALFDLDHVAYVRFASVYREFKSVDEFMSELKDLISKK